MTIHNNQLADPQHVYIRTARGKYVSHSDWQIGSWQIGQAIRFTRTAATNLVAKHESLHDATLVEVD